MSVSMGITNDKPRVNTSEVNMTNKCIAVVMSLLMVLCAMPLAACSSESTGSELSAQATTVVYDASGEYTTTLKPRSDV